MSEEENNSKITWEFNTQGKEAIHQTLGKLTKDSDDDEFQSKVKGNERKKTKIIHGLKITLYIDPKSKHERSFIEDCFWDHDPIEKEFTTQKEMFDSGFKAMEIGMMNLFMMYPEIIKPENIDHIEKFNAPDHIEGIFVHSF